MTIGIVRAGEEVAAVDDATGRDAVVDGRQETPTQRADRNFTELLQELRVAQTGVQILFAFLLTLPFTPSFGKVSAQERVVYLATLIATALATSCLIAPVSHHRVLFRRRRKPHLVEEANRFALVGLMFLLISVVGSVYLIFDVVVGTVLAGAVAGVLGLWLAFVWYLQPLLQRRSISRPGAVRVTGPHR